MTFWCFGSFIRDLEWMPENNGTSVMTFPAESKASMNYATRRMRAASA